MRRWWLGIGLLVASAATVSAQTGLLIVAHGADSGWNARVRAVAAQVQWQGPVRVAFLMGSEAHVSSFSRELAELVAAGAKRAVVVPLMVSTYGGHIVQIHELAMGDASASPMDSMTMTDTVAPPPIPVRITAALDSSAELGDAITARWKELLPADRRRPLMLVAHGPNGDTNAQRWIANLGVATRALGHELPDGVVHVGLLRDDAPAAVRAQAVAGIRDTIQALATRAGDSVMVMTVLISSGSINNSVVPHDLAGMPMRYDGAALAPDPALARWIERVAGNVDW